MLVLTRFPGESIVIGGSIIVTVNEIRDGAVRLGFEADPSIVIDRLEIHNLKLREKEGRQWPRVGGDDE